MCGNYCGKWPLKIPPSPLQHHRLQPDIASGKLRHCGTLGVGVDVHVHVWSVITVLKRGCGSGRGHYPAKYTTKQVMFRYGSTLVMQAKSESSLFVWVTYRSVLGEEKEGDHVGGHQAGTARDICRGTNESCRKCDHKITAFLIDNYTQWFFNFNYSKNMYICKSSV